MIRTRLQGTITTAEAQAWEQELYHTLEGILEGTHFTLISDLSGYEPADLAAHKAMRSVIPRLLALYGFRTGLIDLVEAQEPVLATARGIVCTAVAHVHHDAVKMANYDTLLGRATERFFSNFADGATWMRHFAARQDVSADA